MAGSFCAGQELSPAELRITLLRVLECSVCSKYMTTQTILCENGHTICQNCRQHLETCPTCRGKFIKARNLFIEELAGLIQYPCENSDYGCPLKLPSSDLESHGIVCDFRAYTCFLGLFGPCNWKGVRSKLLSHVRERHYASIISLSEGKRSEVLNYNNVDGDSDLRIDRLLICCDEMFRYVYMRNVKEEKVFCIVQYIGKKEKAEDYRYKLIMKGKSEKKLSYCSLTQSDIEDPVTLLESGDCFSATFQQINHIVQSPMFSMYVSVKRLSGTVK